MTPPQVNGVMTVMVLKSSHIMCVITDCRKLKYWSVLLFRNVCIKFHKNQPFQNLNTHRS